MMQGLRKINGMKTFRVGYILVLVLTLFACKQKELDFDQLQEREGIFYEINQEKPFTGVAFKKYENGQFAQKTEFKKGKQNGKSTTWNEQGEMTSEYSFKDGVAHGAFVNYLEGKLRMKGYVDEKTIEQEVFNINDGSLRAKITKKGVVSFPSPNTFKINEDSADLWHLQEFQEGNILVREENFKKGTGFKKEFYENGNLFSEKYYKNHVLDGFYKTYFEDGTVSMLKEYIEGKLNGFTFQLDQQLDTIRSEHYLDNEKNGMCRYWTNGVLQEETEYKSGMKHGSSKIYYPSGFLMKETAFQDNQLVHEWQWYNYDGTVRPALNSLVGTKWITTSIRGLPLNVWFTSFEKSSGGFRYSFNCYTNNSYELSFNENAQKLKLNSLRMYSTNKYIEYEVIYFSDSSLELKLLPTQHTTNLFAIKQEGDLSLH